MLRLNSKLLSPERSADLAGLQQQVDSSTDFELRARKANSLWDVKPRALFAELKTALLEMCVGVEICVYCETNEATDVEHIFPKKLYPERAFSWENYLLACGKCNTHHKSDRFKIFNPAGHIDVQDATSPRGTFVQPANDDALFVNQRIDNPLDFLELDLIGQRFVFIERHAYGTREQLRAKYTIEVLGLNTRAALISGRKSAAKFFLDRLETYVNAKNATNWQELKDALSDFDGTLDKAADFAPEKQRLLTSIKRDIQEYSHPTVWKELVRQRENLSKTRRLLAAVPEALLW